MRLIRHQVQYLSSFDRQDAEYINSFTITYPDTYLNVAKNEIVKLSLISFTTPNYFYWTNRYNNAYNIKIDGQTTMTNNYLPIGFFGITSNLEHFTSNVSLLLTNAGASGSGISFTPLLIDPMDGSDISAQYRYSYSNTFNKGFTLTFTNPQNQSYNVLNSALLLGFNPGGNYTTTNEANTETVPYSFYFPPNQSIITTSPPIVGSLPFINMRLSVSPQNIAFDTISGFMSFTESFAYIPIGTIDPFSTITYIPPDLELWTWLSPSSGTKMGTIRYELYTPGGELMPMIADYYISMRFDIYVEDAQEEMRIMKETLKMMKLLLIQNDHNTKDLIENLKNQNTQENTTEPEVDEPTNEPTNEPDDNENSYEDNTTGSGRADEDFLNAGQLIYMEGTPQNMESL